MYMYKSLILILNSLVICFLSLSSIASAECWVASGFKGYSSKAADEYIVHEDGIASQKFIININGSQSSVTGSDGISFTEVTPQLIVGVYRSAGYKGVVESWGIDIEKRKVFYAQTKSGYSLFDGGKMFIGVLEGKCN